jgi:hypothetical protein
MLWISKSCKPRYYILERTRMAQEELSTGGLPYPLPRLEIASKRFLVGFRAIVVLWIGTVVLCKQILDGFTVVSLLCY